MGYRPGFQYENRRLGAPLAAIVPASIISGLCGTLALMLTLLVMASAGGGLALHSLEDILSILVASGMAIAMGAIGGTFVVGFFILLVGFPVAVLFGDRLKGLLGLVVALLAGIGAAALAAMMLGGGVGSSGSSDMLETTFYTAAFALPAAYFYRRQVISMLDTYET